MATAFPGGVDSLVGPQASDRLALPKHSVQHSTWDSALPLVEGLLLGPLIYNVRDPQYAGGAKGDGITDDYPAIRACLTASHGSPVYFPAGTYLISQTIVSQYVGQVIIGHSKETTTVKASATMDSMFVVDGHRHRMEELTFDGGGTMAILSGPTRPGGITGAKATYGVVQRRNQRGLLLRTQTQNCNSDGWHLDIHYGQVNVLTKALTSNVATLTTDAAHGFSVGDPVFIAGVDATFNGTFTVSSTPTTTSFTYAKVHADVVVGAATGTAAIAGNLNFVRMLACEGSTNGGSGLGCPIKQTDINNLDIFGFQANFNMLQGMLVKMNSLHLWGGGFTFNGDYGIKLGETADTSSTQSCYLVDPYFEGNITAGGLEENGQRNLLIHNTGLGIQEFRGTGNTDGLIQVGSSSSGYYVRRSTPTTAGLEYFVQPNPTSQNIIVSPASADSSVTDASLSLRGLGTGGVIVGRSTGYVSFYDRTPIVRQVLATGAGASPDDIIAFLQLIGLCKQS